MTGYVTEVSSFARVPLPKFEERLRSLCLRKGRPVLHGEVALEVGCSLEHVAREMQPLLDSGVYRVVGPDELRTRSLEPRALAYALVIAPRG